VCSPITKSCLPTDDAGAQPGKVRLPTPDGLIPCNDNDPIVSAEKRVAASLQAEYLACFTSSDKTPLQGTSKTIMVAVEHAVAMSAAGGPFSLQDLDALLSQDRERWQNFDPLREHSLPDMLRMPLAGYNRPNEYCVGRQRPTRSRRWL
jgi:hypothetical protein